MRTSLVVPMSMVRGGQALLRAPGGAGGGVIQVVLLVAILLLQPGSAAALEWTFDISYPMGSQPSIALRSDGTQAMAYVGGTGGVSELRFRTQNSECSWGAYQTVDGPSAGYQCELVCDQFGYSHIAYLKLVATNTYQLWYAKASFGSYYWTKTLVSDAVYGPISLVVDASGAPHVFFHGPSTLQYRRRTGSTWTDDGVWFGLQNPYPNVDVALGVRSDGVRCFLIQPVQGRLSYTQTNNWGWRPVDPGQEWGLSCAISFDPAGLLTRIAFQSKRIGEASVAPQLARASTPANDSWSLFSLDQPVGENSGTYIDLAMAPGDLAHVVYSSSSTTEAARYVWEATPGVLQGAAGLPGGIGLGYPNLVLAPDSHPIFTYSKDNFLYVLEATPGIPDVIPPAQIAAPEVYAGVTTLAAQWIATGDDGNSGRARNYDVRYSQSPITNEASFYAANQVLGLQDCPGPPGSMDCAGIDGLAACSPYYVAVRARDNAGNWSPVSPAGFAITRCSGFEVFGCSGGGGDLALSPARESSPGQVGQGGGTSLSASPVHTDSQRMELAVSLSERDASAPVSLRVFDVQGRLCRDLYRGRLASGLTRIEWDMQDASGARVPSGTYFLVLVAGSRKWSKAVVSLQ